MSRQMFVNLPVKDLARSTAFFSALGFSFDQNFTDENAASMVVGDGAFVMLLVEPFFQTFTTKAIVDATAATEVVVAISAASPEEVDELVGKALENGGSAANDKNEMPGMVGWSFHDPDGHLWEVVWMDPAAMGG